MPHTKLIETYLHTQIDDTSFWVDCFSLSAILFRVLSPPPQAVFGVFKEVRRPQVSLVGDLVSAVLHPTLMGMAELNAVVPADAAGAAAAEGSAGGTAHQPEVKKGDGRTACMDPNPLTDRACQTK